MPSNSSKKDKSQDERGENLDNNVPFEELIKIKGFRTLESDQKEYQKRVQKFGEEVPPYDPYLSSSEIADQESLISQKEKEIFTQPYKSSSLSEKQVSADGYYEPPYKIQESEEGLAEKNEDKDEPAVEQDFQSVSPTQVSTSQYKDEQAILEESINFLSKEFLGWKQKLEYYGKNKVKILEEKKDFVAKKEEVETSLKPILEEEKKIEDELKMIEEEEEVLKDEASVREKEKERWSKEDKRQVIEKKKWGLMEDLKTLEKFIQDKDEVYQAILGKEAEAEVKISEIESEKKKKEVQLKLIKIRRVREAAEKKRQNLFDQVESLENNFAELVKNEESISAEKKKVEEQESEAKTGDEEMAMEAKRWELEKSLREVEQKKWEIADTKKQLEEQLKQAEFELQKILKEEKQISENLKPE